MRTDRVQKVESYIFLFVLVLNLAPVFLVKFFPSVDGPAHLYNSNILNQLLFTPGTPLSAYFMFNPAIVPNWFSSVILSAFNLILPAFIAEKILIIFFLVSLPVAFRRLVKAISPENYVLSYLIFPLTYSIVLLMGFYNFSAGLIFLLFALSAFVRNVNNLFRPPIAISMLIWFILIYFSHVFIFVITLISISMYLVVSTLVKYIDGIISLSRLLTDFLKKAFFVLLMAFIPLIMMCLYYYPQLKLNSFPVYLGFKQLSGMLMNMHVLIMYNFAFEQKYTQNIIYILVVLFAAAIFQWFSRIRLNKSTSPGPDSMRNIRIPFNESDTWLLIAVVVLVLFFKMPESNIFGGFISIRLSLMFYLFFFLWLSAQRISWKISGVAVFVLLSIHFNLMMFNIRALKVLDRVAQDCNNASIYIKPNSIVLPVNCSDDWKHYHFSNYSGVDKPLVILDNYECMVGYFPLKWNENQIPNLVFGNWHHNEPGKYHWVGNYNCRHFVYYRRL